MGNFWNLIRNENMKIYNRLRTWIMLGFVVLVPVLISVLFYAFSDNNSQWGMMMLGSQFDFILITIFAVVIAAESVAGEFTMGTIKLLLIRPWSRAAILLSKFISIIMFALFFTVVSFVVSFLINVICFGYTPNPTDFIPALSPFAGDSPWLYSLMYYLDQFIVLLVVVSFGFMLSSAFRSSGLAIGLSLFLLFSGNIIGNLLAMTDRAWVKYILFPNQNLTSYLDGASPFHHFNTTFGFSLGVLAVYFILFNIVSWTVFTKRDVAG